MQADEYGQTRGTRFVARRLEVVAVAGLLWISWCVLGAAGFFLPFFCLFFFKQKTAYEIMPSLVGSEMCIRDSHNNVQKVNNHYSTGRPGGLVVTLECYY